ncbi:MAG: GxxExxY protein [Bacteroidota bacterium]
MIDEEYYNKLSYKIIECCYEVHSELGPGLMESVYETCLMKELENSGLSVKQQEELPIVYKGEILEKYYKADIIVEDLIIIELKSVETILRVHKAQLVSYLKLSGLKLGLLINFNEASLKNGICRRINGKF